MSVVHPGCDSAVAQCVRASLTGSHPNWILVTTILASALAFVDGSVVNVALPTLAQNFNADAGALQWVINSYLLPLSALLLLGGAAGDHFGRRRLLILGTSVFALASLGSALAPTLPALFASRVLQGIGAALLMPNSLAILGRTFSGESKGRAIGIWAATGAAMAAIGPVLGGWLIDLGSWRAIFLLNLPLAGGAIILAWRIVPDDRRSETYPLDLIGGRIGTRLPLTIGPLVVAAGFLIALRMDSNSSYWTIVLPMIVVIALGMSAAVAPLTTAVLTSVDQEHTGSASGINSAVARTGGLVATALLGSVLAAEGDLLLPAYHVAMGVGACICAAASLSASALLERK